MVSWHQTHHLFYKWTKSFSAISEKWSNFLQILPPNSEPKAVTTPTVPRNAKTLWMPKWKPRWKEHQRSKNVIFRRCTKIIMISRRPFLRESFISCSQQIIGPDRLVNSWVWKWWSRPKKATKWSVSKRALSVRVCTKSIWLSRQQWTSKIFLTFSRKTSIITRLLCPLLTSLGYKANSQKHLTL